MASNLTNLNLNSPSIQNQPLYEEITVIGTGAYGTVYKGVDLKTSQIVAMKRIRIQITEEGLPISTIREIAYLRLALIFYLKIFFNYNFHIFLILFLLV
jgi:serine/threonine protein kinase